VDGPTAEADKVTSFDRNIHVYFRLMNTLLIQRPSSFGEACPFLFAVLPRTHCEWRTSKGEINYRLSAPPRRECRECMEELRSMKLHLDLDGVTLSFGQLPLADHSDVGPPAGSVHFRTNRDRSKLGFGNFRFMPSSLSTTMLETARFRNHFLLEGIMNHGLSSALQRLRTLS